MKNNKRRIEIGGPRGSSTSMVGLYELLQEEKPCSNKEKRIEVGIRVYSSYYINYKDKRLVKHKYVTPTFQVVNNHV